MRFAAAAISLIWLMDASPIPSISRNRASGACMTSANDPNFFNSDLASGLVSRRGTAANSAISSSS
jgi:hypothetical protein